MSVGSWKIIQDPRQNPDRHQKQQGIIMYYPPATFGDDIFSGFCVIVLIHEKHTHVQSH